MSSDDRFNPMDYPLAWTWPRQMSRESPWVPLIPFGMALVEMCRPERIVELGTLRGDSYCAMCQAVEQLKLPTRCTAVDTWEGDAQNGRYGPEVLQQLRAHHDPQYGQFSNLLQSTFDDALAHVPDGTVDLLHIDGLHTYEAVKHDFDTWRPKLSERGVVMFHDTQVRERDFGVWKLWEELSPRFPNFEFHHAFGLGVIAVGPNPPPALLRFLDFTKREGDAIRAYFKLLGDALENARTALLLMTSVRAMQLILDQRKQLIGDAVTSLPPRAAFDDPINYMDKVMFDVQNLAAAELRHRGYNVHSQPPPVR
jgi:O-antigen biosynthesis protein